MTATSSPEGIVAHMNKSHKLALEDYLYAYGSVRFTDKIAHVRLENIDLTHMTLQFNHFDVEFEIEKVILLEPPLKDWSEARPRLVEMAETAAAKRGYSHVQINEISHPKGLGDYAFIMLVFFPLACYYYRRLLEYVPFIGSYFNNGALLLGIEIAAFAIHIAECVYVLKPRLEFYRVPTDFLIEWYFFGMLEGYPAVRRFDQLVKEKI
ncbi:LANO_0H11188g1_1 [Lachancea nothofagi CBS 11611]|uniref:LANO_0H11188g1_1 n=1 Tax=Lachancea nothofagi CBS 11611 TaxID=1266666 RepID=A0A1G4KM08_9SACH|nr:LANO_0H11188g1_1 [Lachancea nothofagi CBS 11611]